MIYRADPDLDAAVSRFDVERYLSTSGVAYTQAAASEIVLGCPRCGRAKLYVNRRTKRFICFHCAGGFQGGLVRLIATLEDRRWSDVIADLLAAAPVHLPAPVVDLTPATADVALPPAARPVTPDDPYAGAYWEYLMRRRVHPAHVLRHQMHYCRTGYYAGRVIVPVTRDGVLVSWVARAVTDQVTPKVLTPPGNSQGRALFNLDAVRPRVEVVLTEGVFDALRAPDCCVATFGKRLTQAQKLLLLSSGVGSLVIAWDADAPLDAARCARAVDPFFTRVRVATLPHGQDPSDMDEAAFRAAIDDAAPVAVWQQVQAAARVARGVK